MQRSLWMRPALQKSEAVLMPALQRRPVGEPQFSDLYYHMPAMENPYRPAAMDIDPPASTTALSIYVRPRGSFGGRSVLRAAGVSAMPVMGGRSKPTYYQRSQASRPRMMALGRFR